MSEQVDNIEIEEVETVEEVEQAEVDTQDEDNSQVETEETEEALLIGDEEASPASSAEQGSDDEIPEDAPNWAKNLRHQYKELVRENKQLKQSQAVAQQPVSVTAEFTEKMPDLEDPDVDWDKDKLAHKMAAYFTKKREFEESQKQQAVEAEKIQQAYQVKLSEYNERKNSVAKKFPDYATAEKNVIDSLPLAAQNAVLMYAENPELIVLAAGRKPEIMKRLTELSSDPVALGVEIGKLSKMVKSAPKAKSTIAASPQVKAGSVKPSSAAESKFKNMFPDAIIR